MNINPYIYFGGKCAEAFNYYKEHLGAQDVELMSFRGSPGEEMSPPEWLDKIMHASLTLGSSTLMGSDGMPGQPYQPMQGSAVSLALDTPEQAERAFAALADGGTVTMPMAPSFFAERFGIVTDRFGVAWMVICEVSR